MTSRRGVATQPHADVLLAIAQAKEELTKLVNDGLAGIQLSISHLQREHDQALLEQAKMNATFTTRAEHTATADRIAIIESTIKSHDQRLLDSTDDRARLHAGLAELGKAINTAAVGTLHRELTWLVSTATAVLGGTSGFLLAHFIH